MEERIWFQSGPYKIEGLLHRGSPDTGVVITHPHPLYGGDMDNFVVKAIVEEYRKKGYSTLRFNFRGVGGSEGEHGEGVGEQEDVKAAVRWLQNNGITNTDLAGYSFGAWVNAHTDCETLGIRNMLMVSPPVDFMSFDPVGPLPCLKLAVCGDRDEYATVENVRSMVRRCNPDAIVEVIPGGNHFYSIVLKGLEDVLKNHLEKCEDKPPLSAGINPEPDMEAAINPKTLYRVCNPSGTPDISKEEDRKYYIDFSSVRPGNPIREMKRGIRLSDEPSVQLFTGHTGCGKSTELLRLKKELEEENYHVLYSRSGDTPDTDGIGDLLRSIARQLAESMRGKGLNVRPEFSEEDFPESGSSDLSDRINREILIPAGQQLKEQGKAGLVIIVDHPDIFGQNAKDRCESLKRLHAHMVLSIPLASVFSADSEKSVQCFGGKPKILGMIPVQFRNGEVCEKGMTLLKQMVMTRAFPDVEKAEQMKHVSSLFAVPEMLETICRMSGGNVKSLMHLLFRCLEKEDPPFSQGMLKEVLREEQDDLMRKTEAHEKELLRKIIENQSLAGEREYESLLNGMSVFEYQDRDGAWFGINPLLNI